MAINEVSDQGAESASHHGAVAKNIADDAKFDSAYVIMNALATVVACYGLLENSTAVVIGAMIITRLLGPISGVGLALTRDLAPMTGAYLGRMKIEDGPKKMLIRVLVRGPVAFTQTRLAAMQSHLPAPADHLPVELRICYVHTDVMSAARPVYDDLASAPGAAPSDAK